MNRSHLWKLLLTLFLVGWALFEFYPPQGRDLVEAFLDKSYRHDATFTNILAELKKLQAVHPDRAYGNLRAAIGTNDITAYFPDYDVKAEKDPTLYILNRLQREAAGRVKLGLDLVGGSSFLVEMQTNKFSESTSKDVALANAVDVLRRRVDKFGVAEPLLQSVPGQNLILIQMPGLTEDVKESVRKVIEQAAFLEFRLVHEDSADLLKQGIIPPGYEIKKELRVQPNGEKELIPYVLSKERVPNLSGKNVKNAGVIRDNMNRPEIAFGFDSEGAKVFGDLTSANVGRQLAIILDGELYSAPVIRTAILEGNGVIQGSFEETEAFNLANVLQNPLEAPVQIIEERTVDPSLGRDSITSGVTASIIAAVCTFLFMLVFYFASGLVANLALFLNVLILMGVMCAMGSTLTMPGIAGIALTIGMAVDANVLIYERMREEIAAGKSLRGVINAGYQKAFGTIFDSNLTTVIAAIILIWLGTGPVKGFGVTLTIGICVSMFTALVVTRLIYDFLLSKGWLKQVRMLPIIKFKPIPFMSWGKVTCAVSVVLILAGMGYGVARGKKVMGVDFLGGEALTMSFAQRVEVDQLRGALEKGGVGDSSIQYQRNLSTGLETLQVVAPSGAGSKAQTALKDAFPKAGFSVVGTDSVGPTVGAQIQRSAIIATILALFAILVYVAFRYEFSFAVASVAALLHDVLLTLGIYFLSGRQLTAPMVAAVLTIIGYSINDKIVIMDRIREDLKLGVRGSFREIIDLALNQTLSRTMITGGAVILATLSLYFFGGGVINDFAFTFLVGILSGTYSSLLIASPIVLWWHKGQRPAIGAAVSGEGPTAMVAAKPAKA